MSIASEIEADVPLAYWRPGRTPSNVLYSHMGTPYSLGNGSSQQLAAYTGVSPDAGSFHVGSSQWLSYVPTGVHAFPYAIECCALTTQDNFPGVDNRFLILALDGSTTQILGFSVRENPDTYSLVAANVSNNSGVTKTYGVWHHFFADYDGTDAHMWIDGTLTNTVPVSITQGLGRNVQVIAPISGNSMGIFLAEIAIYTHTVSSTRVAAHATAMGIPGLALPTTGTLTSCA